MGNRSFYRVTLDYVCAYHLAVATTADVWNLVLHVKTSEAVFLPPSAVFSLLCYNTHQTSYGVFMQEDIRYIQRFENFEKSFLLLTSALDIHSPSIVEKAGVIQFFETTFELSWKLMKDYLTYLGYDVNSPREAIKKSFSIALLDDGEKWLNALVDRNLTVHTYDESIASAVYLSIKNDYYGLLADFYRCMKGKICLD